MQKRLKHNSLKKKLQHAVKLPSNVNLLPIQYIFHDFHFDEINIGKKYRSTISRMIKIGQNPSTWSKGKQY